MLTEQATHERMPSACTKYSMFHEGKQYDVLKYKGKDCPDFWQSLEIANSYKGRSWMLMREEADNAILDPKLDRWLCKILGKKGAAYLYDPDVVDRCWVRVIERNPAGKGCAVVYNAWPETPVRYVVVVSEPAESACVPLERT